MKQPISDELAKPSHKQHRQPQYENGEGGGEFSLENGVDANEASNNGESGGGKRKKRGQLSPYLWDRGGGGLYKG